MANGLWDPAGVLLATPANNVSGYFSICQDGEGGAYLAWSCYEYGTVASGGDIWAQRIDSNGNAVWAQPVPICRAYEQQDIPEVALHEGGGGFIVWEDWRGFYSRLGAQRVSPDGRRLWGTNGLYFAQIGTYYDHEVLSDREGGFLYRNSGYVIRFDEDGQLLWFRQLSSTGWAWAHDWAFSLEGRIYVPYYRQVPPTYEYDVYGRCFNVLGQDLWGGERPLVVAPADQLGPGLALTRNGFIMGFGNYDYGPPEVLDAYLQIVDSTGQMPLGMQGLPNYVTHRNDGCGAFISDGQNGAIAFFQFENPDSIMANRILPDGSLGYPQHTPVTLAPVRVQAPLFFNGSIQYRLSQSGQMSLELYDLLGRRITTLREGYYPSGDYMVPFDEALLPSGVYVAYLKTPAAQEALKVVITR